jgi:PEP-CTERM motif
MKTLRAIGLVACAGLGAIYAWPARCEASVIINIVQSGGNVVETGSGTINLSALTSSGSANFVGAVEGTGGASQAIVGPSSASPITEYTGVSGPSSLGPGTFITANSGSGQTFGIWFNGQDVVVPAGYTSGAALSGSSTCTGTTIAGLGLTPGTYIFNWGTAGNADSLTVQIGAAAVPEPSTWAMMGLFAAGAGVVKCRRRKASR